jgi:hypothetical protein
MVLSVFAIAFAGTAGANRTLTENLESGDVIFQGETLSEADITGSVGDGDTNNVENFTTDTGEVPLRIEGGEIPQDQQTGVYTTGDDTLTVRAPSISDLEVINSENQDVAGGNILIDEKMNISVTFNYANAENMTVSVENEAGIDVTSQFLNETSVNANKTDPAIEGDVVVVDTEGTAVFSVYPTHSGDGPSLARAGTGTYTITAEGAGSLDFGSATQSTTVTIDHRHHRRGRR